MRDNKRLLRAKTRSCVMEREGKREEKKKASLLLIELGLKHPLPICVL
jgi:hypothetical protein